MINALRAEWGKTWSVRSSPLIIAAVAVVVPGTAAMLSNDFVYGASLGEHDAGDLMPAADVAGSAAQVGLAVFTAFAMLMITAEYSSGSIRATFEAEPRRALVVTGKSLIAAFVGFVVGIATGAIGLAVATLVLGRHAAPVQEPWMLTSLRVGLVFATSAVLVVGLGTLVRSSVGTLAGALVILIGTLVLPDAVSIWTPGGATAEFVLASDTSYPAVTGLVVNAGWAVAAYGAAVCSLRRRDA